MRSVTHSYEICKTVAGKQTASRRLHKREDNIRVYFNINWVSVCGLYLLVPSTGCGKGLQPFLNRAFNHSNY